MNSFNFGRTISLKTSSCSLAGWKILLKVKRWKSWPPLLTEFLYVTLSFGAFNAIWKCRCYCNNRNQKCRHKNTKLKTAVIWHKRIKMNIRTIISKPEMLKKTTSKTNMVWLEEREREETASDSWKWQTWWVDSMVTTSKFSSSMLAMSNSSEQL